MRITTQMMLQLEQAIAPDAKAEIRLYSGGCDIRVSWNKGLRTANQNLGIEQLSTIEQFRDEKMEMTWQKLIAKFQGLRDHRR